MKATLSGFVNETFFYEFSNSISVILQLSYICDLPVVAVVSLVHVAVCTPEVSVFGNLLDCQRNASVLFNSCKFLSFLSQLFMVLVVTSVAAALYIPSAFTRFRNNGDFPKITAHSVHVKVSSLFVLISQFL